MGHGGEWIGLKVRDKGFGYLWEATETVGLKATIEEQIALVAENGLQTIRSYHIGYAEKVVPTLKQTGMSLMGGMHVDAEALVRDWRSQVRLDELACYHELGVPLEEVTENVSRPLFVEVPFGVLAGVGE